MDLKEYFRALDEDPAGRQKAQWDSRMFHHHKLVNFPKVTIAMVNGWCFGGGFSPLCSCDLAIAAEEATFGLSEVNWGIIPAGYVSKDVVQKLNLRDAFYYTLTGEPFDGRRAAEIGPGELRRAARGAAGEDDGAGAQADEDQPGRAAGRQAGAAGGADLNHDEAWDYLVAKNDQLQVRDPEDSRNRGIRQFIDEKKYRPGLGPQPRPGAS